MSYYDLGYALTKTDDVVLTKAMCSSDMIQIYFTRN